MGLVDEEGFRRTGGVNITPDETIRRMQAQTVHDFQPDAPYDRGPGIPYAYSNNPAPGQWDGRTVSRGRIADYKRFVGVDGEGIRHSLYVSGCNFRCKNCFQPSIFDFNAGFPYTRELEDKIIDDLSVSFVQGLTLLGGEPMVNTPMLIPLVKRIRRVYGDSKDIWCWTGYTWEELHRPGETPDKLELLDYVDVLVDGRYMDDLKNPSLQFRGSSNQRIIDVRKSIDEGKVHIWDDLNDGDQEYREFNANDRIKFEGSNS